MKEKATEMRNLVQQLRRYLELGVERVELSAGPPFVKVIFSVQGLLRLAEGREQVANLLATCFVRRRVFWIDIRREDPKWVVKSLVEVESDLDQRMAELATSRDLALTELTKAVREWGTATSHVRKALERELREINDEKATTPGYDTAGMDRRTVVGEALVSLRQRVYPWVYTLASFLPEDDETRQHVQRNLFSGLDEVPAEITHGSIPEFVGTPPVNPQRRD